MHGLGCRKNRQRTSPQVPGAFRSRGPDTCRSTRQSGSFCPMMCTRLSTRSNNRGRRRWRCENGCKLLSLVEVDCLGMNGGERGRKIHLAHNLQLAVPFSCGVDDHEIVGGDRPQADRVRRIRLLNPVPFPAAAMEGRSLCAIKARPTASRTRSS